MCQGTTALRKISITGDNLTLFVQYLLERYGTIFLVFEKRSEHVLIPDRRTVFFFGGGVRFAVLTWGLSILLVKDANKMIGVAEAVIQRDICDGFICAGHFQQSMGKTQTFYKVHEGTANAILKHFGKVTGSDIFSFRHFIKRKWLCVVLCHILYDA